jgi:hypothetical protein
MGEFVADETKPQSNQRKKENHRERSRGENASQREAEAKNKPSDQYLLYLTDEG